MTEDGHLFRFKATSQGPDDDWGLDDEPYTLEVRAWSLVTALRKALALTEEHGVFGAWTIPDAPDEPDWAEPDDG